MALFALWSVWAEAAWWSGHEVARAIRLTCRPLDGSSLDG